MILATVLLEYLMTPFESSFQPAADRKLIVGSSEGKLTPCELLVSPLTSS